jgi:hypothetical protein
LSDELGTAPGNGLDEGVTPAVAADDDSPYAAKIRELESHIGRQNNVHGQRLAEARAQIDELKASITRDREDREQERLAKEQREFDARIQAMNPSDRALAKAEAALKENQELRRQLTQRDEREQERKMLGDLVAHAKKMGMPEQELDVTSFDAAVMSFDAWERADLRRQVQELKAAREQEKEDLVDAVRGATGARKVASGTAPAGKVSAGGKYTPEQQALVDRFEAACTRPKPHLPTIIKLQQEALRAGMELNWSPT